MSVFIKMLHQIYSCYLIHATCYFLHATLCCLFVYTVVLLTYPYTCLHCMEDTCKQHFCLFFFSFLTTTSKCTYCLSVMLAVQPSTVTWKSVSVFMFICYCGERLCPCLSAVVLWSFASTGGWVPILLKMSIQTITDF